MPDIKELQHNEAKLIAFLESLDTEQKILENSAIIYGSVINDKKAALENIIRFGNLSAEVLENENSKLNQLMNYVVENNLPVPNTLQMYLVDMSKLVKSKLDMITEDYAVDNPMLDMTLAVYENQMFDYEDGCDTMLTESMNYGSAVAVTESFANVFQHAQIKPSGILETCRNYFCCDTFEGNDDHYKVFKDSLTERIKDTLVSQTKRDDCHDLPILTALDTTKDKLKQDFCDKSDVCDKIDDLFDDIYAELDSIVNEFKWSEFEKLQSYLGEDAAKENFNPNPFANIYNMTPFPVGSRTVYRTMEKCLNANTDEALVEALNEFGTLLTVCECYGEEILTEGQGSAIAKAQRAVARGGAKVASAAKGVAKNVKAAGATSKRIVDPMVRFIEDTYDGMAKYDHDERKKIAMTKGLKGKLKRILKWLRDVAILGVATGACASMGFTAGTVIAAIALVGYIARNAVLDNTARKQVVAELEDELRICQEKIEDARGDENKQKRYELMRIENKLKKELHRVNTRQSY